MRFFSSSFLPILPFFQGRGTHFVFIKDRKNIKRWRANISRKRKPSAVAAFGGDTDGGGVATADSGAEPRMMGTDVMVLIVVAAEILAVEAVMVSGEREVVVVVVVQLQ